MRHWLESRMVPVMAVLLCACFPAWAQSPVQSSPKEAQNGRYELVMMNGRAVVNNRVPAIIVDTYQGIVWTCQNLQDGKPLWVKTDLGQNGNKEIGHKKYVARMLEWQDADLRMPAVVLDFEDGVVWNCPNVIDGRATWIRKDLKEDKEEKSDAQ